MLARFWSFARPYLPYYLAGLALLLVTNGLGVAIPWVLRDAIHALEGRVEPRAIAGYAAIIVGLGLAQALVRTLSRWSVLGASRQVAFDLRQRFFAQLQRLDAPYYDTHRTGDIMSRGVNDIQLVQMFYGPGALNLLNTTIVYVAALALMFRLDARLTLVALTLYPPLLWAVNRLSRKMYARSVAVQEGLADISSRAQENVSGIQQVKLFVQEDREIAAFRELCGELRRRNLAMVALRGGMLSLIGVFSGIGTLVVLFVGGRAVISGRMSFGDFVAFNAYLGMLAWPTIALGWIINVFQRGAGAMERLDEVLRVEPRIPPPGPKAPGETPLDGDIEIRGLTFAYGNEPALRDVTLDIPRGSRVALVGPVGSGKSTLVHLLARIYPAPAGTVFVDGSDLTALPTAELRQGVGMVPQEAFLFSRSIRDNVLLGRP
ncbi:MAG TPA: ABC transporter transmembrane domain-containing protein, partial [Candidatus Polarisedimenticolaceae bacterium]|nr:ABC transporter transmembrane domain-containing protein [Candidatus Polarisedimenticolaceae bacterium]